MTTKRRSYPYQITHLDLTSVPVNRLVQILGRASRNPGAINMPTGAGKTFEIVAVAASLLRPSGSFDSIAIVDEAHHEVNPKKLS